MQGSYTVDFVKSVEEGGVSGFSDKAVGRFFPIYLWLIPALINMVSTKSSSENLADSRPIGSLSEQKKGFLHHDHPIGIPYSLQRKFLQS